MTSLERIVYSIVNEWGDDDRQEFCIPLAELVLLVAKGGEIKYLNSYPVGSFQHRVDACGYTFYAFTQRKLSAH